MGTISSLMDRLSKKADAERPAIVVTAFGFTVGPCFVAWQAVTGIEGCKGTAQTSHLLEFNCNGQAVQVSQAQCGFEQLEHAMKAVFPATAHWRETIRQASDEHGRVPLYRRT